MGEVYAPERVSNGQIPSEGGIDQLDAAGALMNRVRSFPATGQHARLLIPGSTATGQANRRSDVDYFLVTDLQAMPPHRREIQSRFIASTLSHIRDTYHVRLEGQHYTERELASSSPAMHDAFWLSHCLEIQRKYPDYSHRQPLEPISSYAIGFEQSDNPEVITLTAAIGLKYMSGKIGTFAEAREFDPSRPADLRRFQRALEAPKAYARKLLAFSTLDGFEPGDPDVTSRDDMRRHTEMLLDRIDKTGKLTRYNNLLTGLDAEYDDVLDRAHRTGNVDYYEKWLHANYLPACALALRLAEGYRDYMDRVSLDHADVSFWTYGINPSNVLDPSFAEEYSYSEPLNGSSGSVSQEMQYEEISETDLYKMDAKELDAYLNSIYGTH